MHGRGGRNRKDSCQRKLRRSAFGGFVGGARDYFPVVHGVVALLLILLSPLAAGAEEGRSYLEMTGGYKTGDFGTPTRSELYYVSPTLGYVAPRYDLSITTPYLFLANKTDGETISESGIGDVNSSPTENRRLFVPRKQKPCYIQLYEILHCFEQTLQSCIFFLEFHLYSADFII